MLLSVENISFTYPATGKPALSFVSLTVEENEYVAVLGANGSGKSTLARCIAGLLHPDSGFITLNAGERVPSGLVFQSPGDQLIAETVELDIAFGPENIGLAREEMLSRVSSALDTFALRPLSGTSTHELSSGQKQHLALAGVYALSPAVLLLDEPTSMLSPLSRLSLMTNLDRYHRDGGTILHITHDLEEASHANRVIILDDGQLVFDGKPDRLRILPVEDLRKWGLSGDSPEIQKTRILQTADTEQSAVLECKNLEFGPLHDFSLRLSPGTITAIMGESGSGKSILLEILAGLRLPQCGSVFCAEGQLISLAVQESEASLFAEFVADDVSFGPRNAGVFGSELISRVTEAMNLAGLPFSTFADRRTFSLSGGERRKAALAGIIAMNTSIVLLDEPSSALDTRSRSDLLRLILALKQEGKTVVFTTNRSEECIIADTVIELPVPTSTASYNTGLSKNCKIDKKKYTKDQLSLEKLRKGASGSYRELSTPIHRLAPISKYVLTGSCIAAALAVQSISFLIAVIFLECIPVAISRYSFKKLARGILVVLPWLIILGIFQYFMAPGNMQFVIFLLRFIALLIPLTLFVFVTAHTEIMYGMEDCLSPLKVLHVPVRDISLVTGIVFRFISLLYEEAVRITTARIIRGAGNRHKKGLVGTVSSMASLFVPLVLRTLTRAERLSEAITARYYGTEKNSRYLHWQINFSQRILIIAVPLFSGLLILLSNLLGK